jgi:hypothetical protein
MDIPAILTHIRPNAQWSLNGDTYDGLVWLDDSSKPSEEEIATAWPEVQVARRNEQAQRDRAAAYKAEADPLFFKWQRGEGEGQAWLDAVEVVRLRFPYVGEGS